MWSQAAGRRALHVQPGGSAAVLPGRGQPVRRLCRPVTALVDKGGATNAAPSAVRSRTEAASARPILEPLPAELPSSTPGHGETDSEPEQEQQSSVATAEADAAAGAGTGASPDGDQDMPAAASEEATEEATEAKSDEYSETMNRRMGTSLQYRHELGIDFNRILPDLIVGSCLQTAADVDRLAEEEGVTTVYCLQEDSDMAYFSLDITAIEERCRERGDIKHVRFPIRDFDPYDLRRKLPRAVSRLAKEHDPEAGGTVYIHCTAGMGRAPATALAYMVWIRGHELDDAHALLTSLRKCGPKLEAIRSATSDLLLGVQPVQTTIALHRWGSAQRIQVAGLDVGWHAPLDMRKDPATKRYVLQRRLYPGKYQYKFILDGKWSASADHPTVQDGTNVNNLLEVIPASMDEITLQKQLRYLTTGSRLTDEEHAELHALLNPWRNTTGPTSTLFAGANDVHHWRAVGDVSHEMQSLSSEELLT